jgi:hypothetical protein
MRAIPVSKISQNDDEFEVEYEILPPGILPSETDARQQAIFRSVHVIDDRLEENLGQIVEFDKEIDRLTNDADPMDYAVAVGSGLLAGLVDSFWVGEWSFDRGNAWSYSKVNDLVVKAAKQHGYEGEGLEGAIGHLERKFPIPSDSPEVWRGFGSRTSPRSHHIDDLAHHPTLLGLFASILTQFTGNAYFSNKNGNFLKHATGGTNIQDNIFSKIFCGSWNWLWHLFSDMAGTSSNPGAGMGIPGPIGALLKELSAIPGIRDSNLPMKINYAFIKEKFDFRSEIGIGYELGRQTFPVILNEVIVRVFYFIRRLIGEIKEKKDFNKIEWKKCLPWKNRTIVRMLTIAHGTFVAIDLADAGIRAFIKSGGHPAAFGANFLLRVNFVGVGRFVIAVSSDVIMGMQRSRLTNKRIVAYSERIHLLNAKVSYRQAEMWIAAEATKEAINKACMAMQETISFFINSLNEIEDDINKPNYELIEKENPGLKEELSNILKWG